MLIRKKSISQLIKKEREKERKQCIKESTEQYNLRLQEVEAQFNHKLKELQREHKKELLQKEKEIRKVNKEAVKNYDTYNEIRRREKHLDLLSREIEDVVDSMVIRVQESLQPFFRTRSKVDTTKRKGDKAHDKVESIFRAVK